MNLNRTPSAAFISVVLPVYNELQALPILVERISSTLDAGHWRFEIVFVNDGSTDGSTQELARLSQAHDFVRIVSFSRNFGHQAAVQAGMMAAQGDAIILMDSDLQDDPHALTDFLAAWQQDFDIVYAVRTKRKEHACKRFLFDAFYRILNAISSVRIPVDAGNFSLLDRRVVETINALPERDRYFPGLRSWAGFRQTGIEVERCARYDDVPRVSLLGLFRLAKTAMFSFSNVPLTMFYAIGGLSFCVSLILAGFALYHKLITGDAIPGWTSTTIVVSLFGAINSLGIAILGEYAARIYDQVRARPNYIVDEIASQNIRTLPTPAENSAAVTQLLEWLQKNQEQTHKGDPSQSMSS
ncbi:glycosyltransferase family 2 protein [uncultured Rubinisphaera sp.]|uniref:glycosyltransferase family 2 protein n=1 Tax=uncultured Rubinisphaera sp. TaxID=1678686 RepID=UPI0030D8FD27